VRMRSLLLRVLSVLCLVGVSATFMPAVAQASPNIPPLLWPSPAPVAPYYSNVVTSPNGTVTVGCSQEGLGQDLVSYNPDGVVVRSISRLTSVDGVANCIGNVVVDEDGVVYGVPYGQLTAGGYGYGPNLLAYSGNTLLWKYPLSCSQSQRSQYALGADGNIYATTRLPDGVHLIGITRTIPAGQSAPGKVLDIKISNDCSTLIQTYKDGIFVHGQNSSAVFYSYSGQKLAETGGNIWEEKISAEGRLFVPTSVASTVRTLSVSAFDPTPGVVAWLTTASTLGANTNGYWLTPTPGGGVIALVYEQRMAANGIPAVPSKWGYTLVPIDQNGIKGQSRLLQDVDSAGNAYWGVPSVIVDTSGKAVIVRQLSERTSVSYPTSVGAVEVTLMEPRTGLVSYTGRLSGNAVGATSTLFGYSLAFVGINGPVIGNQALFIQAQCRYACSDTQPKLFPLKIPGLTLDYPRGAVLAAYPRPSVRYLALGDSFSSGEGVPPFESGTSISGINTCHRSSVAYPRLIAGSSSRIPSLAAGAFRACSGAQSGNIWDIAQADEGIQIDRFSDPGVQVVTITIGGNDVDFTGFAQACVLSTCDVGSVAYNKTLNLINQQLDSRLKTAYTKLLQAAPKASIYVLGYPQVIAAKSAASPTDLRCVYMQDGSTRWGDARAARDIVTKLNARIASAVGAVRALAPNNTRLKFVDPNTATSPFKGHEICGSSTSWFVNVNQAVVSASYDFHPNASGQKGYAQVMSAAINAG
jgi:lysophospholipase L1-like esterase